MIINEIKIRRLIRSTLQKILFEKIELPHPDDAQEMVYNELMSGKKLTDIFPNFSREALEDKVKRLHDYIRRKKLPMPQKVGDATGTYARFKSETVSLWAIRTMIANHFKALKKRKLNHKSILEEYFDFIKNANVYMNDADFEKIEKNIQNFKGDKFYNDALSTAINLLMREINGPSFKKAYNDYVNADIEPPGAQFIAKQLSYTYFRGIDQFDQAYANYIISKTLFKRDRSSYINLGPLAPALLKLKFDVIEGEAQRRNISTRKTAVDLKNLATEYIKGDIANWFAVHYVGAFGSKGGNYFEQQTRFLKEFGGPEGITSDEFAGVAYPKAAKKLNDSIASGREGSLPNIPKIAMILNGTVTSIYSDDVYSDTEAGSAVGKGFGGFDKEGKNFVRFPGGEKRNQERNKALDFAAHDSKILYDLDKAEQEIANASQYPGERGYYECFVDDWYVAGIICNWKNLIAGADAFASAAADQDKFLNELRSLLSVVKEKNIKVYDQNFRQITFNSFVHVIEMILTKVTGMAPQVQKDNSLKGYFDDMKTKLSRKK